MAIGSRFSRIAPENLYNTRFGLPQPVADYLNQPLPDISGIFSLPQATEVVEEDVTDTGSSVGLTPEQLRLLYPQTGGGDDRPRGGGDFGNLDLSDTKDFFINGEVVTGYRNLNSGLYQDLQGKNIQNLGIRNLPGITGLLDKIRGDRQIKYPGYFDYYNVGDLISNPRSFSDFFKSQTPTGADIARYRGQQKKTMQEARDITQRIQKQTPPTPQDSARGGGGGGGGRSFSPSPSPARTSQGVTSAQHSAFRN